MKKLTLIAMLITTAFYAESTLIFKSGTEAKADQFGVRQYRIPHVTKGPNGELVVAVAGRCTTSGDNGRTTSVFSTSTDDGKTWTPIRFESDYSKPTPKGEFPMSSRTNEVQVEWFPAINSYVAIYCHKYKCYQIRSKDLKTWSEPKLIPFQEGLLKAWPSPTSMYIEKDGTLCFGFIAEKQTGETKKDRHRGTKIYWTKDGENFECSDLSPYSCGESSYAKTSQPNEYLVISRSRKGKVKGRLMYTYNRKTKKWGELQTLPAKTYYSCQQDLTRVGDKLYTSFPTGNGRLAGVVYMSKDDGKSWTPAYKLPADKNFGYSALVAMENGALGIVYETKSVNKKGVNLDIVFKKLEKSE